MIANNVNEETISWKVDDIDVYASLTRPTGAGPFPAVIFVAGSGPTDRNWNSPILPGSNGSGGLLAGELTRAGFVTLRYDKRASGPHMPENIKLMAGKVSMQGHTAELAGGASYLRHDAGVDPTKIFVLTNSEGCVHALNYQTEGDNPPFAGMVLTSAFARATGELAHDQIAAQLGAMTGGEAMLAAYDTIIDDFVAGRPVKIDENLPEGLQQVVQSITQPINQPFSRELWIFNPLPKLAKITVPVLIVIGKKDIQVDWQIDGALFEEVATRHDNISVSFLENANHVLKLEPKPRAELNPVEVSLSYSSDEVMLDAEAVGTITAWLKTQV